MWRTSSRIRTPFLDRFDAWPAGMLPGTPSCRAKGRRECRDFADAPVQLIFVVDVYWGMIAAHVRLFAAAHELAAWFHNCERNGGYGLLSRSDIRQRTAEELRARTSPPDLQMVNGGP